MDNASIAIFGLLFLAVGVAGYTIGWVQGSSEEMRRNLTRENLTK